jgi:hypothetical protein
MIADEINAATLAQTQTVTKKEIALPSPPDYNPARFR